MPDPRAWKGYDIRIAPFIAASLMIAGIGIAAPAEARPHGYHSHHRGWAYDRGYRPRPYYARAHRGYARGFYGPNRRCFTEWRHHRRVTICRY